IARPAQLTSIRAELRDVNIRVLWKLRVTTKVLPRRRSEGIEARRRWEIDRPGNPRGHDIATGIDLHDCKVLVEAAPHGGRPVKNRIDDQLVPGVVSPDGDAILIVGYDLKRTRDVAFDTVDPLEGY